MYGKLLVLCCVAVAALAREYPAGVHPAVCPNYPYCDTGVLARFTPDGIPIPEWGLHSGYAAPIAAFDGPARYPAGVHPAACPNYPFCH